MYSLMVVAVVVVVLLLLFYDPVNILGDVETVS